MCFSGAGHGLSSPNKPVTPGLWPAAHRHPRRLPSHWGGEKERAKLLHEFLLQVIQVNRSDRPVARLIGATSAPGTQPARCLAHTFDPVTVGTPGASACAGTGAKTAAHSCRRRRVMDC